MAIILFDDFEAATSLRWESSSNVFFTTLTGMFGRCLRVSGITGSEMAHFCRYNLIDSRNEGFASFAFIPPVMPAGNNRIFAVYQATTIQLALRITTDGKIAVLRDTTQLAISSSPVITAPNLRYRIEFGFEIHASTGTARVVVNGTEVINATGLNTRNGIDGFTHAQLIRAELVGNADSYFDDFLIDDDKTAFRGDFYGLALVPVSDVSGYSTPSTGSDRWAMIDELPYSATDYNTFPGTGEDIYGINDLSDTPDAIHAVCVNWVASKNETGVCDMRSRVYSGAATDNAANRTINTAPQFFQDIRQVDPDTSAAWLPAAVNAMTVGIERTA